MTFGRRTRKNRFRGLRHFPPDAGGPPFQPRAAGTDNEDVAYFEADVKARLGWEFATTDDIRMFFRVVGDPEVLIPFEVLPLEEWFKKLMKTAPDSVI